MRRRDFVTLAAAAAAWPAQAAGDRLDRLASSLRGRLVRSGDADYDGLRQVVSAKAQARPLAIARCLDEQDVRRAVDFAADRGLPLAVRAGGHSNAGFGVCDGGLVVDLREMSGVALDPARRQFRLGGGVLAGAVDQAGRPAGLAAVLGECPTVGVAGYALGGGEGHLSSRRGLGCDTILGLKLVTADGRLLTASAQQRPELFWAARGGGGNFGVVTEMTLKAHPVGAVLGGLMIWPAADIPAALRAYREAAAEAPDALSTIFRIQTGAPSGPAAVLRLCWSGDLAEGDRWLDRLRKPVPPRRDTVKALSYFDFQAQAPAESEPVLDETRAGFVPALTDDIVEMLTGDLARAPAGVWISIDHLHGATTRAVGGPNAFPLRRAGFDVWLNVSWDSGPGEAERDWLHRTWARLSPLTDGAYVNGLDAEGPERVRQAYGERYARLARVKAIYDPANLFRRNQNILPA